MRSCKMSYEISKKKYAFYVAKNVSLSELDKTDTSKLLNELVTNKTV